MITPHTCYRATCTGCGSAWAEDFDGEPHFTSETDARTHLAAYAGWIFDADGDWCQQCAAERHCERLGCHWGDPITGPDPHPAAYQHCTRCGNARLVAVTT